MVVRSEGGAGGFAAHQRKPGIAVDHSRHLRGMPSTPYDAKGLLKAAKNPRRQTGDVHRAIDAVWRQSAVPEEDYSPLRRAESSARVRSHRGTYSRMVLRSLVAAEEMAQEGTTVEVMT
jgi:pyruvate/2-oxoglutarate/acetoin dehydrogenase E1 component